MSRASRRGMLVVLACLGLGFVRALPASAAEPDPLPRVRDRMALEAQRVEKEVQEGRRFAYATVGSNASRAIAHIKSLLTLLEEDRSLKPARRRLLVATLEADLRRLSVAAARLRDRRIEDDRRAIRVDTRRAEDDDRTAAAKRLHRDLTGHFDKMAGRVADARGFRDARAAGFLRAGEGVMNSATLPKYDYELPKDWVEKSMRRSPAAKLTAKERAILEALNKPIAVDFDGETFQNVIDYLQKVLKTTIIIDKQGMEEAGATYETPIRMKIGPAATRTILKRLLSDLNMAYIIKNETIQVTSLARARETMTTRTYYIGDLVAPLGRWVTISPALNRAQMALNVRTIINTILNQVDPQSWNINNPDARGAITYDPIRMALIITQSAEFHYRMGGSR